MNRADIPTWVWPVAALVVVLFLFLFVSATIAMAVVGLGLAGSVVVFAGWRRLVQVFVVILLVTFFASMLIRFLPGDPTDSLLGFATPEQKAQVADELGLNDPFYVQYGRFVEDFFTGETRYYQSSGRAIGGQKVWERLGDALPISLQLMFYAQILALVFALPIGIFAAYKAGTRMDKGLNTIAFGLLSLPNFVLAYILIYWLAVKNNVFPSQGYVPFGESASEHFKSMFLPSVSLAVGQIAIYMRLLRSDMIQTLQEDFITMARAKGLTTRRILLRHALRPSSFSLLTVAAINLGALIGGAVVLEVVFQLGGVGTLIIQAVNEQQFIALQTFVGLIAIAYVGANVAVDVLYSVLDPRIRHARAA